MFSFEIHVEVESDLPLEELRKFRDKCHEAVSSAACYLKHARLPEDAETISTHVGCQNYIEPTK